METPPVLILGCGYTGRRVAQRLARRGVPVTATTRHPKRLHNLAALGVRIERMDVLEPETLHQVLDRAPEGGRVLHSIPVVEGPAGPFDPTPQLLERLRSHPTRVVYLSTTGVYGACHEVDETTPAAPTSRSDRLRVAAEQVVAAGPWSWLILRPAAIYGPGRGVHESLRRGRFRLVDDGSNYVSRIHVEDLAALAEAALLSGLTGFYPVADEEPCTSREMAEFCAQLIGAALPPPISKVSAHRTRRANRRVDGRTIFRLLGVQLRYPSYREGVPAALAKDSGTRRRV